ncbi:hypothetical protein [Mitsuaria sp. BK037]|nr:hypothetical protein [Mitsuaria sp. BK037]MBB3284856.1 hypothetical protein [Mitsuaria sp. BK037]
MSHAFYLAIGWAAGLLLLVEVLELWRRARQSSPLPEPAGEEESA